MSQNFYYTSLKGQHMGARTGVLGSDGTTFMIRYEWPGTLGGADADTFTGIEPGTGSTVDGVKNASGAPTNYVGWNNTTPLVYTGTSGINDATNLMYWGGDNTTTAGQEAIIIRPSAFFTASPSVSIFNVGLYLNWYNTVGIGCLNVKLRVYNGGTYTAAGTPGFDITSTGTLLRTYTFNANTNNHLNPGGSVYPSNGINGYQQIGIFSFNQSQNGYFDYNLLAVGNC